MFSLLNDDRFLKIASFVCVAALIVQRKLPQHTIAHQVAEVVTESCIALGVYSTASRARKEESK